MTTAYASNFHSRLAQFRTDDEFTDITVTCKDTDSSFKCHRIILASASEFFRRALRSSEKARKAKTILVGEVSTTIFHEVLRFMYTGDASITPENLMDMLRAGEFFRMPDLEELCVSVVTRSERVFTVKNVLDAYSYACVTKKDRLTDIITPHLAAQLELFSKADEFLKIPSDALNKIVTARLSLSPPLASDEVALAAIIRWVGDGRDADRLQSYPKLKKLVSYDNISPTFTQFLADSVFTAATGSLLPRFPEQVSHVPVVAGASEAQKSVHLYVRYASENRIRILSIDNTPNVCRLIGEISPNEAEHSFATVAVNDVFMYSLRHSDGCGKKTEPIFSAHTSADMRSAIPSKRPPVCFERVNLCAMRNSIYAYHEDLPPDPIRAASIPNARTFDDHEIIRGLYAYNCELDDWFPVPAMRRNVSYAAMTVSGDSLFLIGGNSNGVDGANYFQAYDSRMGSWRELQPPENDYVDASACCLQGNVYIFGGHRSKYCETYDVRACRWERLMDMPVGTVTRPKVVSYGIQAWCFSKDNIIHAVNGSLMEFQTGIDLYYDPYGIVFQWNTGFVDLQSRNPTNLVDCVVFNNK